MDILDIDGTMVLPDTYLVRDLGAESIDLMELAVTLNALFHVDVDDDELFLFSLRRHLAEADEKGEDQVAHLKQCYPYLCDERIREILADLDTGPVLKIKDLTAYILHKKNGHPEQPN